ncbi:MAG: HEAT repeat domain-containing protein [Acidimicrobiales bacterium]
MIADDETQRGVPNDAIERRVEAAGAGLRGDEDTVRALLSDSDAKVRSAAYGALVRLGAASADDVARAIADPDPVVRRSICELAARLPGADFTPLLGDPDPAVVEAAAYALGETGARQTTPLLAATAIQHPDPLCREAAVAALGAIGDPAGKWAVLGALSDAPAIRRRAVVALSAFEGPDVEVALVEHLSDRDWQTRQAAADVLGVSESEPR